MTKVAANNRVLMWARKRCGLSVEQAALRLRCSLDLLSRIESGARSPHVTLFRRMSCVYELTEAMLLGLKMPRKRKARPLPPIDERGTSLQ